jgi:hypothetical protein
MSSTCIAFSNLFNFIGSVTLDLDDRLLVYYVDRITSAEAMT